MKILFLQKRLLFPTDNGAKTRTLNVVRHLARWHDVTYLCNLRVDEVPFVGAMEELGLRLITIPWRETMRGTARFYVDLACNVFSPYPFSVSKDFDRRLRAKACDLLLKEKFDLIICDFVQMARNVIGLPGPRRLLFQHNVEAEIFYRHATTDEGWLRRKYMALQARKMGRFEAKAGRQFDSVVAVSERDKDIYETEYGWRHVNVIDTAVDVERCQPDGRLECPDHVAFIGSLDWLPNVDGIQFFVREVWPRVRRARPGARFRIVGRNPVPLLRRLEGVDGIEVVPNVPDVRPYLSEAAVVAVPLRIGGGTRLKIFEAMAMGKAVVTTTLGAEGLKVTSGEHIELADTPEAFGEKVLQLLDDGRRRKQLGQAARRYVCENFSAETVARQFDQICRKTAGVI